MLLRFLVCSLVVAAPLAAFGAKPKRPTPRDEIIVSGANYARSSRQEIQQAVNQRVDGENPTPPPETAATTPQRYLFTRGEIAKTDVTYEELCRRLAPVLAQKGFVNAVNAQGRVPDPENIQLVLRISYGSARWRNPTVRTTDLTWKHGLVPRSGTRGIALNALATWDQYSGGVDDSPNGGGAGGDDDGGGDELAGEDDLAGDDYFLLVLDAFDYRDLLKNRHHSKRVWTTFISVPKRRAKNFSEIADAMMAKAAPYFGETTAGRLRFTNDKASVHVGELLVVDDDVKSAPSRDEKKK